MHSKRPLLLLTALITTCLGTHSSAQGVEPAAGQTDNRVSSQAQAEGAAPEKQAGEDNHAAEEREQHKSPAMDELIIRGRSFAPLTEIDPETERLLNVAGAGMDPLAAVMSLPGVTFASDYSSEPEVRGSAPAFG